MKYPLLDKIMSPADVARLNRAQLEKLCGEVRGFLVESVSQTGGHLSSNLGVVELTVALCHSLRPEDRVVFDVGHQCYTYKLLTGRKAGFGALRRLGGLSGFPNPSESPYDAFVSGHGSTSLSVAIGIAQAKRIRKEPGKVFALIGDGAFTGGMVYEGINNIDKLDNLVVILNDNKMSISKSVGHMAQYLTKLRTNPDYYQAKVNVERALNSMPVVGLPVKHAIQRGKKTLRRQLYHSTLFEELGFQYVGPVDGHDVTALAGLLANIRVQTAPVLIHAVTQKGRGFAPAEENPGEYHGVGVFNKEHINPEISPSESYSTQFGQALAEAAKRNKDICAVTAAMKYGTGLQYFYHAFPQRFFDVGMAEQHAVTFAGGLASQGLKPVVAIYSTFFQRAYDQLIHDISLMKLDVLFAVDRAGLVPGDGRTHQGIFDVAFFSEIGFPIVSPCNYAELRYWLERMLAPESAGPRVLRYPRGGEAGALAALGCTGEAYRLVAHEEGAKVLLTGYGAELEEVLKAAALLKEAGCLADVAALTAIYPLPEGYAALAAGYDVVLFAEECTQRAGIGPQLAEALLGRGWNGRFLHAGVDPEKTTHAAVPELRRAAGLDAESLAARVREEL